MVTTVFGVLWNCASWTFSGIGRVLIKHVQYHWMSSRCLHWGGSNDALRALLVPLEPSLATRVLTTFVTQRCFRETGWNLYDVCTMNFMNPSRSLYGPFMVLALFTQCKDPADASTSREHLWSRANQSQSLRLHGLDRRLQFLGGARQALAVDTRRVRKDVRTYVTPLRCVNMGP